MNRKLKFSNSNEEITNVSEHFKKESELEREDYNKKTNSISLKTRIETGVSIHPLEVIDAEFYFGDSWKITLKIKSDLPRFHSFHPGTPISIFRKEEREFGTIQKLNDKEITIIIDSELPNWLEEGIVGIDLFYSEKTYKEGEKALQRLIENNRADSWKKDLLLGYNNLTKNYELIPEEIQNSIHTNFNPNQINAIMAILENKDAMVIQGPPGTGKTSVLIEAIRLLVKMGKKVLVSTPTNSSLDLLLERILQTELQPIRIGQMARVAVELLPYTLDYKIGKHSLAKSVIRLKKEANNLRKKAYKYYNNYDSKKKDERNQARKDFKGMLEEIRNMERHISNDIIATHNPILSTNVSAASSTLNKEKFDVCILDEATQSLEPLAWIPLLRAQSLVLTGDRNQLPPTILSKEPVLQETLFLKSSECFYNSDRYFLLNIQYRMEEEILGFSNLEFYEGKVLTDSKIIKRDKIYKNIFKSGIVFIDTAGNGFNEECSELSESIKNHGEAKLISSIINYIQQSIDFQLSDIGIISPYKEQVYTIKECLPNELLSIEVSTVDSFQGREKDIIMISLTRSNDGGDIGFLKDYRRMNVSLTRARKLLIIVGDSSTLSQDNFYSRLLDYVHTRGDYRSGYEFIEF